MCVKDSECGRKEGEKVWEWHRKNDERREEVGSYERERVKVGMNRD